MDEGIADAVGDWETRPFTDGYRGLQALSEESFSGAVEADGTWALFINGRVVGVHEGVGTAQEPGDIETFEGASGTIYEAPHDSLPLLFTMQLDGGEVVRRNTTSDRPIEDVHRELSEEGFTGYLELSEHVVSGDYYIVYQRGKSMNVAFIGNARRLKTGEEAFERTTTEVGVYEVHAVPLSVVDIPEPGDAGGGDAGGLSLEAPDDTGVEAGEPNGGAMAEDATGDAVDESAEPTDEWQDDTASDAGPDESTPADLSADSPTQVETEESPTPAELEAAEPTPEDEEPPDERPDEEPPAVRRVEGEWEASQLGDTSSEPAVTRIDGAWEASRLQSDTATVNETSEPEQQAEEATGQQPGAAATAGAAEIERLEERFAERLEALSTEQERLAATVEQLEERLDGLVAGGEEPFEAAERRSAADALAETRLLVRPRSESGTTLADIADGVDRESLAENLLFEPRTPFPVAETEVGGTRYLQFLEETVPYQFVEWLVTTLPFEIRDAGSTTALQDLYEAFPAIDRATFGTNAAVEDHAFDVTIRNGEDDPLIVARIDESPDPPGASDYESLLRAARDVNDEHDSLAAAFLVTGGYIDESELAPIDDATKGGVLSRDKRESYVSVSGGGFHVCLVEGGETFHLRVPRL